MEIKDNKVFQPSSVALNMWLSTRKSTHFIGGADLPGFFNDVDFNKDSSWFFFAMIGEVVGFALTIMGGMKSRGIFLAIAIVTVLVFIILDIAFARLLHQGVGEKTRIRTMKLLLIGNTPEIIAKRNHYNIMLKSGNGRKLFLSTCIILIAIFKAIGIILLGVFNSIVIYIPIIIVFFLIAYAHIYHTGYYFASKQTQNRIDKEHNEFSISETKHRAKFLSHSFIASRHLSFPNNSREINFESHSITKRSESPSDFEYTITAKGVLTDADAMALISNQDQSVQLELFRACRQLQLNIISAADGQSAN